MLKVREQGSFEVSSLESKVKALVLHRRLRRVDGVTRVSQCHSVTVSQLHSVSTHLPDGDYLWASIDDDGVQASFQVGRIDSRVLQRVIATERGAGLSEVKDTSSIKC